MSRCFPFTPRGCVRKGENTEAALIESIKLQNTETSQTNRQKEKKTRKEGRKKLGDICDGKVRSVGDQNTHEHERRKSGVKRKHSHNGNEQVERSDLTEEHGQPLYFLNSAYLSDSTQSSDKKRNDSTLLNHSDHPEKRRVIRIRFNPENHSDRKNGTVEKQNSSAERPGEAVHESKRGEHCTATSKSAAASINTCKIELPCLATGNRHISTRGDDKACSTSMNRNTSHQNGVEALELQYKNLIESWNPELLQSLVNNFDDTDWLFETTHPERPSSNPNLKLHKAATTRDQTCRNVSLWPRAQYLPEAGIYALPYSLPF